MKTGPRLRAALAGMFPLVAFGCGGAFTADAPLVAKLALPAEAERLRIDIPLGAVTVTASAAGEVAFDAIVRRWAENADDFAALEAIAVEPRLTPVADRRGTWSFAVADVPEELDPRKAALIVKCSIGVPAGVAVEVVTGRGDVSVIDRQAAVQLRTGAGKVLLERVHGAADVESGTGEIIVHGHRGDLRAATGFGTVTAYVDELGPAGVRLETREPSMIVYLPPDSGFDLDARVDRSTAGKIGVRQPFGVPVEEVGLGHRAAGSVRGGGPPVRVQVGRGYLSVVDRRDD